MSVETKTGLSDDQCMQVAKEERERGRQEKSVLNLIQRQFRKRSDGHVTINNSETVRQRRKGQNRKIFKEIA